MLELAGVGRWSASITAAEFLVVVNFAVLMRIEGSQPLRGAVEMFDALNAGGWKWSHPLVQEQLRKSLALGTDPGIGPVARAEAESMESLVSSLMTSIRAAGSIVALEFMSSLCPPRSRRDTRFGRPCDALAFGLVHTSGSLPVNIVTVNSATKKLDVVTTTMGAPGGVRRPEPAIVSELCSHGHSRLEEGMDSGTVQGSGGRGDDCGSASAITAGGDGASASGEASTGPCSLARSFLSVLGLRRRGKTILLTGASGVGKSKLGLAPAEIEGAKHIVLRVLFTKSGSELKPVWRTFEAEVERLCSSSGWFRSNSDAFATALFDFTIAMYIEVADAVCDVFLKPGEVVLPLDAAKRELYAACLEELQTMDEQTRVRQLKRALYLSDSKAADEMFESSLESVVTTLSSALVPSRDNLRKLLKAANVAGRTWRLWNRMKCEIVLFFDEATSLRNRLGKVFHRSKPAVAKDGGHRPTDWFYGLLVFCDQFATSVPHFTPVVTGSHFSMIEDGVSQWSPLQAGGSTALVLSQFLHELDMKEALKREVGVTEAFFEVDGRRNLALLAQLRGRPSFFFFFLLFTCIRTHGISRDVFEAEFESSVLGAFREASHRMYVMIMKMHDENRVTRTRKGMADLLAELLWADRCRHGRVELKHLGADPSERGVALSRGVLPINPMQEEGWFDINQEPVVRATVRFIGDRMLSRKTDDAIDNWLLNSPDVLVGSVRGIVAEARIFHSIVKAIFQSRDLRIPLLELFGLQVPDASPGPGSRPRRTFESADPYGLKGLIVSACVGFEYRSFDPAQHPTAFHALFETDQFGKLVLRDGEPIPMLGRIVLVTEDDASGPDVMFWAYDDSTVTTEAAASAELRTPLHVRLGHLTVKENSPERDKSVDDTGNVHAHEESGALRAECTRVHKADAEEIEDVVEAAAVGAVGEEVGGADVADAVGSEDDDEDEGDDEDDEGPSKMMRMRLKRLKVGLHEEKRPMKLSPEMPHEMEVVDAGSRAGGGGRAGSDARLPAPLSFREKSERSTHPSILKGILPVDDEADARGPGLFANTFKSVRLVLVQSKASNTEKISDALHSLDTACMFLGRPQKEKIRSGTWKPRDEPCEGKRKHFVDLLASGAGKYFASPIRVMVTPRKPTLRLRTGLAAEMRFPDPLLVTDFSVRRTLIRLGQYKNIPELGVPTGERGSLRGFHTLASVAVRNLADSRKRGTTDPRATSLARPARVVTRRDVRTSEVRVLDLSDRAMGRRGVEEGVGSPRSVDVAGASARVRSRSGRGATARNDDMGKGSARPAWRR